MKGTKYIIALMLTAAILIMDMNRSNAAPAITRVQIIKDFKKLIKKPENAKTVKVYIVGKPKTVKDKNKYERKIFTLASVRIFEPCSLKVRYTWKISYSLKAGKWSSPQLQMIKLKKMKRPKAKEPLLNNDLAKEKIKASFLSGAKDLDIEKVTVMQKTFQWDFCNPRYLVKAEISCYRSNPLVKLKEHYLCRTISIFVMENKEWKIESMSCTGENKKAGKCSGELNCTAREIKSTIDELTSSMALELIKSHLQSKYHFKKTESIIETFKLLEEKSRDKLGRIKDYVVKMQISMDENIYNGNASSVQAPAYKKVRAVYACHMKAQIKYSYYSKQWEVNLISCCPAVNESCGNPCSTLQKACPRLGIK